MTYTFNSSSVVHLRPGGPTITLTGLIGYISSLADKLVAERRHGTARTYLALRNFVTRYVAGADAVNSPVDKLCVERLSADLRTRSLSNNTISFYLRVLRTVLRRAYAEHFICEDPAGWFAGLFTGFSSTVKRALPIDQLRRIAAVDCGGKRSLLLARDIFIFSYQGRGIPFVDVVNLRRSNISDNHLIYRRHKTGQLIAVELQPLMLEILLRYHVESTADNPDPYLFPVKYRAGQEYLRYRSALTSYNRHLRIIAELAGIKGKLSSYTPRHTWATEAHNSDVPLRIISQALGHQSERTTAVYLAYADTDMLDRFTRSVSNAIVE